VTEPGGPRSEGPHRRCGDEGHKELVEMFVFVPAVAIGAGLAVGGAAGAGLCALAAGMNGGDS
jgi:hypothetical protein